ncbi:MAG TPA: hypothetical protein VMS32_01560 [Verrucomicrobiae bacterium]|jgi:hypothetical protein|nr:hypothetical protein [Verrucomicrobiae bacterium]
MLRCKFALVALAMLGLTACGGPGGLPLHVRQCDTILEKGTVSVRALFRNRAAKPVTDAKLEIDFYHDFKFTRVIATADFHPNLEPLERRSIALILTGAQGVTGQAQKCIVTHIDYADGTKADVPE